MLRKVVTFCPVRSPDSSRGLCEPIVDEATTRTTGMFERTGGISSLALKKKTHGASAMLLIAGSVSMFCMVRLSVGRKCSSAGRSAGRVNREGVFPERDESRRAKGVSWKFECEMRGGERDSYDNSKPW
jgi:hypothetical protein